VPAALWPGAGWANQASQQYENAQYKGLVAADRGIGADLEVGRAQLALLALLDPVSGCINTLAEMTKTTILYYARWGCFSCREPVS
jgi:hypothetical protein